MGKAGGNTFDHDSNGIHELLECRYSEVGEYREDCWD